MSGICGIHIHEEHDNQSVLQLTRKMLEEILASVSVESLLQYKTISKFFYNLISSPEFKQLQLRYSRKNVGYIICPFSGLCDGVRDVCLIDSDGEFRKSITLPGFDKIPFLHLVCSFNGLLCFAREIDNDLDICICNPITQKLLVLPHGSRSVTVPTLGITFDPENGQYKVFRFFRDTVEYKVECYACEVYSSVTRSWNRICTVEYRPTSNPHSPASVDHVCIGRLAYWFCWSKEDPRSPVSILSVDMKEEKFKMVNLPENVEVNAFSFLIDLDGRLSLVTGDSISYCLSLEQDCKKRTYVDVWVLEDLERSYWSHRTFIELQVDRIFTVNSVVALRNEIFFIITDVDLICHYHVYNLDEAYWRILDLSHTFQSACPVALLFAESLSPCRGINWI